LINNGKDEHQTHSNQSKLPGGIKGTRGERLDVLVTLVEAYERKHFPLDLPDPVETTKFRMEQMDLTPRDLAPMIGRFNRVYEVLNHKLPLTL
jgi:HTH-type transcriptional regulator/antitoxin HigA